jgi:hypothetical protein
MILKSKNRLCRCCLVVFIYCGLLLGWNVVNHDYIRDIKKMILVKMKLTMNFLTFNMPNFHKIILFECYFINNLFKNTNLLQKCRKLLFYIYFRFVFFIYFSFNKFYSKLIFIFIFIQYFFISLFLIFNFIYFNIYITDNLLLFNNILLENYSIFEDIKFDINNNHDLNKDFNVLYFNSNKSLIPFNNNGNNNMNNMNNMNNRNNLDDMNFNDLFNKSKNNNNQDSDTETITLFNKIIHLKKTNPSIFDMIKKHYSDNNNISAAAENSLVSNNTNYEKTFNFSNDNSKFLTANNKLALSNNNFNADISKVNNINTNTNTNFNTNNNINTFMKVVNPIFEDNSSKEELRMPCRIIGPYTHLPIFNKTGTMLSLPFYNGTPTALERLNYELNGTLPDDFISISKNVINNTIKQDGLDIIKLENSTQSNSLLLENYNLNNNLDNENLSVPALESSLIKSNNSINNSDLENAVASSSKIKESSFEEVSSTSYNKSDLLSDPLNYLPDELVLSHILTIDDPNRMDIQPFVGGFDIFGNIHLPIEAFINYQVPDYLVNYDCYAFYDSDLHPIHFNGMLEEAWKHGYFDTIIEFYLEDHNMYRNHYTKDNIDLIIEFFRDKIKQPKSSTIDIISSNEKGKGKAI